MSRTYFTVFRNANVLFQNKNNIRTTIVRHYSPWRSNTYMENTLSSRIFSEISFYDRIRDTTVSRQPSNPSIDHAVPRTTTRLCPGQFATLLARVRITRELAADTTTTSKENITRERFKTWPLSGVQLLPGGPRCTLHRRTSYYLHIVVRLHHPRC